MGEDTLISNMSDETIDALNKIKRLIDKTDSCCTHEVSYNGNGISYLTEKVCENDNICKLMKYSHLLISICLIGVLFPFGIIFAIAFYNSGKRKHVNLKIKDKVNDRKQVRLLKRSLVRHYDAPCELEVSIVD